MTKLSILNQTPIHVNALLHPLYHPANQHLHQLSSFLHHCGAEEEYRETEEDHPG